MELPVDNNKSHFYNPVHGGYVRASSVETENWSNFAVKKQISE